MASIHSSPQTARDALAATTVLMAMFALCGSATAAFYINCAGCHTVPQNGMAIVNFQTTTNLGNGLHKVFKVSPGQTAVIQLNVTNNYGGSYALNINNLDAGGVNNSSDRLAYTADPAWPHYFPGTTTNFFMAGCATNSPDLWTFNLVVKTNTPADFYTVNSQMAGYYASTMWSQQESFYVQVVAAAPPVGKLAPRPLYRDPPFDAPTDPVLCLNAESQKWFMYYTARRATATNAPGVTWVHGSNIGMAESSDGGATWTYRGTADISYGRDTHPDDYTYWAPEVIWFEGTYHMYLSYVPGIFTDWNHPREIVHLTSKDGVEWDTVAKVDLQSERTIDPCVIQLPNGTWRMWYKDEQKPKPLSYADSPDLYQWQTKGTAVTDFSGEGPKVIHWKGSYWLIADCWRNGMRVWKSDDCLNWKLQEGVLFGSHGDVVISGDRAWWFYFGGQRPFGDRRSGAPAPATAANAPSPQPVPRPPSGRTTAINVVELSVIDGKLIPGDPDQPTYIDLKPVREEEK